jgi:hypothetical protein
MSDSEISVQVAATAKSSNQILFLRPFLLNGAFRVLNPRAKGLAGRLVLFYDNVISKRVSLDDALRVHLKPYGEVIAIGAPGDMVGASRVRVSDSSWKRYFQALAENAVALILFPGVRSGMVWEIETIKADPLLLEKTVFMFPPGPTRRRESDRRSHRPRGRIIPPQARFSHS